MAKKFEIRDESGELVITNTEQGSLYRVSRLQKAFMANNIELHHRRLGHFNESSLKKLKRMANGMEFQNEAIVDCESCLKGKQARFSFPISESRATKLLELVHSDLCGPIEVSSIRGSRYFATFVDDANTKVIVYFLERKDHLLEAFKKFNANAERQSGKKLKILRTDNRTEYTNRSFRKVLEIEGIRHQTTLSINGVAERMNHTLVE